ncbi:MULTISPECIES: DnaA inactivator Hda [Pasteurellaceae]|uniref:DnaA regulatory inactivator Hda n=1 Tax=Rodentibacter genomosp. 1 TaxID=1908264 RepID=A0A1V3J108_9PAST|nr:DnaA inactivator Hda [Rodentibacter genomosp. 1]MBF0752538.1 DnaA regulatory inactivator Hda [Pasteurella sp. 19428wF3_WM03]OOF48660.1 DnaA regulatory inactivator Hda [Rodentibacter genomosp. 1]TFU49660.1 DnaA regulatory inactivator Hda [Pasteurella sp. WM03]
MNQQLPLPIHQIDDETLENFYGDNNLLLLDSLHKNSQQIQQQFFYIWGTAGCGKSHLLRALSNQYLNEQRAAIYVPLNKSRYFSPAVLENLEQQELVCLDDLQSVIGDPEWEVAIFDLFNRIKAESKTLLLISAAVSPSALNVQLPDLASRLKWGEIYQLSPLTDEQKLEVLQKNARQRGIELPAETAQFLLKRLNRDTHTLLQTLEKLDRASLQAQRNLTIPFVKETLGL